MDEFWSFVTLLLLGLLKALLPVLVALLVGWLVTRIQAIRRELGEQRWQVVLDAIGIAVAAAEQSGLAGLIAREGAAKKEYAIAVAQRLLADRGVRLDVKMIADLIEAIIFSADWGSVKREAESSQVRVIAPDG